MPYSTRTVYENQTNSHIKTVWVLEQDWKKRKFTDTQSDTENFASKFNNIQDSCGSAHIGSGGGGAVVLVFVLRRWLRTYNCPWHAIKKIYTHTHENIRTHVLLDTSAREFNNNNNNISSWSCSCLCCLRCCCRCWCENLSRFLSR